MQNDKGQSKCDHVCIGPHRMLSYGGSKLTCHNPCPKCSMAIAYGYISAHLRECHKKVRRAWLELIK